MKGDSNQYRLDGDDEDIERERERELKVKATVFRGDKREARGAGAGNLENPPSHPACLIEPRFSAYFRTRSREAGMMTMQNNCLSISRLV